MFKKYPVALAITLFLSSVAYSSSKRTADDSSGSSKRVLTTSDHQEVLLAREDVRSQTLRFYELKQRLEDNERSFQALKLSATLFAQQARLLDAQRSGIPFDINSCPELMAYFDSIQKLKQENSVLKHANLEQKRALEASRLEANALRTLRRNSNASPDDAFFAELILIQGVSANNSPKIQSSK